MKAQCGHLIDGDPQRPCALGAGHRDKTHRDAEQHEEHLAYGRRRYRENRPAARERVYRYRSKHPLYQIWDGIKRRCLYPSCPNYHNYGGRGITMHESWINDFRAFETWVLAHLGPRPSPTHQLDRIDNDGNYEPGNLRWATPKENCNNRRTIAGLEARIAELEAELSEYRKAA